MLLNAGVPPTRAWTGLPARTSIALSIDSCLLAIDSSSCNSMRSFTLDERPLLSMSCIPSSLGPLINCSAKRSPTATALLLSKRPVSDVTQPIRNSCAARHTGSKHKHAMNEVLAHFILVLLHAPRAECYFRPQLPYIENRALQMAVAGAQCAVASSANISKRKRTMSSSAVVCIQKVDD